MRTILVSRIIFDVGWFKNNVKQSAIINKFRNIKTPLQISRNMFSHTYHNRIKYSGRHFLNSFKEYCTEMTTDDIKTPIEIISEDSEGLNLVPRSLRMGTMPHQVLIIHPHIKWGPKKNVLSNPDFQLEEAISLIHTLDGWKVVSTKKLSVLSYDKITLFNKGQLKAVQDLVKGNEMISGVFINVKSLKLDQHLFLEELLGVPVFDRYSIVINIFKRHAKTKEAKLQVSLSEIPYVRSRIKGINELEGPNFIKNTEIGCGETYLSKRLKSLGLYEQRIKRNIEKLKVNRELLRKKRKGLGLPVIAVVGYTNAGKTSLIKCLTAEEKMNPENKLFATLDVTVHSGLLPCNLKVLYVDTIGFITELPTKLLEPFVATLEDAIQADLIIHVQDISHPDNVMQTAHVLKTLRHLNLRDDVMNNIISVGNKHDKVPEYEAKNNDIVFVSCTKQTGFDELEEVIEKNLVTVLNLQKIRIRVKNGGEEYHWLLKEAAVADYLVDEKDQQYIILDVTISRAKLEKFKSYFIEK